MIITDSARTINDAKTAISALKLSDDNGTRYYAAWWLGKHRIYESIHLLCECLKDERDVTALEGYPLRRQAARSLGMLKDSRALPALIEALDCLDLKVQEVVIQALKDIGNSAAIPALIDFLNADTEDKPLEALIEALAKFKVWQVQDKIRPFLQHSSERVKCSAAQYFYTLTLEPHYLKILFRTLHHENRFLRYAAAFDISALGQIEFAPLIMDAQIPNNIKLATIKRILESVLQNKMETEVKRQEQEDLLFQIIDQLLLDAIEGNIPRLNTLDSNLEVEKITKLVNQLSTSSQKVIERSTSKLFSALKSQHPNIQAAAIKGLVKLAPGIIDSIIRVFDLDNDGDLDLRAGLTQVLMEIGDPRTLFLLEKVIGFEVAADHCQGKVRRVASRALGKIGCRACSPEVIVRVIEKLKWTLSQPDDWALRYSAAVSLGEIGNNDAILALQAAFEDESDIAVKRRIERAYSPLQST
ncbi:HEAT repeat domain-containing protein [Richelia intracellularis]|jgi:phycocyanobilin lyase alpha subunit|nr:HEAT repeat domain-containing protein [Richelia intracellularis]